MDSMFRTTFDFFEGYLYKWETIAYIYGVIRYCDTGNGVVSILKNPNKRYEIAFERTIIGNAKSLTKSKKLAMRYCHKNKIPVFGVV